MSLSEEDRDNLVAYLDGELDEETSRSLEARMNTEPALRAELDALKQTWELLDYLPRAEPSATFTNRTVQRMQTYRPISTMTMPQPARGWSWQAVALWVAALLLAGAAGIGAAVVIWPPVPQHGTDRQLEQVLVQNLRLIENKRLYDNIDDFEFLKKLNEPELFGVGERLPAAAQTAPAEQPNRDHLAELREDPELHAQRLAEAQAYLELPPARRQQLQTLDRELYQFPEPVRHKLFAVMKRYGKWLAALPEEERRLIAEAPDQHSKLELIRQLREQQWIRTLPLVYREKLDSQSPAALHGQQRAALITELRNKEKAWQAKWQLASNHWRDLQLQKSLPVSLADFQNSKDKKDKEVYTYVTEYLRPMLPAEEWDRLKKAEGQWPHFPCTLVDIADRHPLALPGQNGPKSLKELPPKVQQQFERLFKKGGPRITKKVQGWPEFAIFLAHQAEAHGISLSRPYELWPTKFDDLSNPVKDFLKKDLEPFLTPGEAELLRTAERRWPLYPETIERLAGKYGLQVPWQTLPGPRSRWDGYRVKNYELIEEW